MHVLTAGDITAPSMPIVGCANSTAEIYELLELLRDEVRQPCAHRFAASRPVVDHLWRACGRAGRRHHGLRRGPVPAHMAMALFVTAPRLRRLHAAVGGGGGAGGAPRVPPPQPQRDSHAVVSRAPMQLLFWSREQPVQPPGAILASTSTQSHPLSVRPPLSACQPWTCTSRHLSSSDSLCRNRPPSRARRRTGSR